MGINFIVVLPRTMEDPDVITRTQLALAICGRRNCRTGKHAGKKEQPRAVEEVENIGIYLYSGSYVLHTLYSAARYYGEFSGPPPTAGKICKEHVPP